MTSTGLVSARSLATGTLALLLAGSTVLAQDTRQVNEPRIPPACTVLAARLTAPGGALPEPSEASPDTTRIQAAIDGCRPGMAVELKADGAKRVFLSGPIQLRAGVTLLVDANTALFASRNPRDYDVSPGSCGVINDSGRGCRTLILAERAPGSGIMGDGAIDGRGGAKLLGQPVSWWDLAHEAKVMDRSQNVPRMLIVRESNDFTLYRITLRNSPNFHVSVERTDGFTAWGVTIRTPKTARNTDGIDPSSSRNVTITHCDIATGDDDVAIKAGSSGPASNITVAHNRFYSGHGMSIGSNTDGGVSAVRVTDLSIDGADNGVRIKSDRSRGGLVRDVVYEDVCIRNVANPILLSTMYTLRPGEKLPVYRGVVLRNVHAVTPGWVTVLGLDDSHRLGLSLDNVWVDRLTPDLVQAQHVEVETARPGNLPLTGTGVSSSAGAVSTSAAVACEGRFPPQREVPTAPSAAVAVPPEDPTLYVAASGTGDYYSIQRAIDVAPETGAVISVAPGTYREVLTVTKPHIRIQSPYEDATRTVVVFDRSAGTAGGTLKSATVNIRADDFIAENLTFANDFNATHPQEPQGSQALALLVTADRAVFRNVRLLGNQDTVYVGSRDCDASGQRPCVPTRQYFANCYIAGNVDFIFGDGKAVFEDCEIHSTPHPIGFVTAQGRQRPEQDSTFVFNRCRLTAEPGVSGVWLGRPWRPYARVVFLDTEMGTHIEPAGWREWHPGETRSIETAFYAEYRSSGPGAHPAGRDPHTHWLTPQDAAPFEARRFLAGADRWDPTVIR